jgi:hypothetical protein
MIVHSRETVPEIQADRNLKIAQHILILSPFVYENSTDATACTKKVAGAIHVTKFKDNYTFRRKIPYVIV